MDRRRPLRGQGERKGGAEAHAADGHFVEFGRETVQFAPEVGTNVLGFRAKLGCGITRQRRRYDGESLVAQQTCELPDFKDRTAESMQKQYGTARSGLRHRAPAGCAGVRTSSSGLTESSVINFRSTQLTNRLRCR